MPKGLSSTAGCQGCLLSMSMVQYPIPMIYYFLLFLSCGVGCGGRDAPRAGRWVVFRLEKEANPSLLSSQTLLYCDG